MAVPAFALGLSTVVTGCGGGDETTLERVVDRGEPDMSAQPSATAFEIEDQMAGSGTRQVSPTDTVVVHYVGAHAASGEVFDSSWTRGRPLTVAVADTLPGWQQGLVGMKVGGRRTLVLPPQMAFGEAPPAGSPVAPGETVVYTIDLAEIR